MSHPKPARLLAAFSAAVAISAAAQSGPAEGVRPGGPPGYQSAFEDYKPFSEDSEEEQIAWRVANDTVGKIGGWRAYANEAQQGTPAVPSQAAGQSAAPAAPHAGHRH